MPLSSSAGRTPGGRPFLLAGFGSLLLLLLVAGGYALRTLDQVRSSDLEERNTHLRRDHALDRIRTGIYQSAIFMRDYLLAMDKKSGAAQIERFAETREQTDQALAECATLIDPSESQALGELRSELQVYWKLLEFISQIPRREPVAAGFGVSVQPGWPASRGTAPDGGSGGRHQRAANGRIRCPDE